MLKKNQKQQAIGVQEVITIYKIVTHPTMTESVTHSSVSPTIATMYTHLTTMNSTGASRTSISSYSDADIASPRPKYQSNKLAYAANIEHFEKSVEDSENYPPCVEYPYWQSPLPFPPSSRPWENQDRPVMYPPTYQYGHTPHFYTGQVPYATGTAVPFGIYGNPFHSPLVGYTNGFHYACEATPLPSAACDMETHTGDISEASQLWQDFDGVHIQSPSSIDTSYNSSICEYPTESSAPPSPPIPDHRQGQKVSDAQHNPANCTPGIAPPTMFGDIPYQPRDKWRSRISLFLPSFLSNTRAPASRSRDHPRSSGKEHKTRNPRFPFRLPSLHAFQALKHKDAPPHAATDASVSEKAPEPLSKRS